MLMNKMAEIKKEEVESFVCDLVARGIEHNVAAPYFFILYLNFSAVKRKFVQSTDMKGCWTIALPSSEQTMSIYGGCT